MKEMKIGGRRVKPLSILGEDVRTGELVLHNPETELTPSLICHFFLVIASLNHMTPEEFAPLLVRGANYLLEDEPDLPEKIRSGIKCGR